MVMVMIMTMSNTEQFLRCETLAEIQRFLNNETTHTNFCFCSDDYDTNLERQLLTIGALMGKLNQDLIDHKAKKKKQRSKQIEHGIVRTKAKSKLRQEMSLL